MKCAGYLYGGAAVISDRVGCTSRGSTHCIIGGLEQDAPTVGNGAVITLGTDEITEYQVSASALSFNQNATHLVSADDIGRTRGNSSDAVSSGVGDIDAPSIIGSDDVRFDDI